MESAVEDFVADQKSVQALVYAIVNRAISDWRDLCGSGPYSFETSSKNFDELTYFFQHECKQMINPDVADRIYAELLQYRKRRMG
jgi:hypothetical protein